MLSKNVLFFIYKYNVFCVVCRCNYVIVLKFYKKNNESHWSDPLENVQKTIRICIGSIRDLDKTKIFKKRFRIIYGQLPMVQDLTLGLKTDSFETFFILSCEKNYNLVPKQLNIVSVQKGVV